MAPRFTIYCHTNRVNGKRYVGQTVYSMEKRWADHISASKAQKGGSRVFAAAIRKYGVDAFDHQVLEVTSTQEDADLYETLWIEQMGCRVPNGYNLESGGGGHGRHHDDTKRLMGAASRAWWQKMTAEERSASPVAEGLRAWWREMTAEEYAAAKSTRAERLRAYWAAMSAEERSAAQKARLATVSPEQRSMAAAKARETRKAKYGRQGNKRVRSSEEYSASIKLGWASMSSEARAERVLRIKEGVRKTREARVPKLIRINFLRAA